MNRVQESEERGRAEGGQVTACGAESPVVRSQATETQVPKVGTQDAWSHHLRLHRRLCAWTPVPLHQAQEHGPMALCTSRTFQAAGLAPGRWGWDLFYL